MDIVKKVKDIVCEQLNVPMEKVIATARFQEDLEADSLDVVELIMALEEHFEISIPDEDIEGVKKVQDAINYITLRLRENGETEKDALTISDSE